MIRGDLLRTKTVQVSAEHEREVRSLGAIQEREREARERVKGREERFWREISRASASRPIGAKTQARAEPPSLTRALEAHRLLKEARSAHQDVTHDVQEQVARVIRSKVAANAFAKLHMKERLKHESKLAERSGEEVAEIGTSAKFQTATRSSAPRHGEQRSNSGLSLDVPRNPISPIPCVLPQPARMPDVPLVNPASTSRDSSQAIGPVNPELVVTQAQVCTTEQTQSLQVRVESRGVALACHLTTGSSGEIGVVVEAPHGGLLKSFERERSSLVTKLMGLGIKVASIEVRRDTQGGGAAGRNLYRARKRQGDDDENTIA